ncbi:MAG TPA: response regulator [Sumerlaeia bacterium]|nr:response regulator [Sumerlaeia bacterium]
MANRPVQILLVEDNPADARLIEEILADARPGAFALRREARLSAALESLDADIDIVLLDLSLPDSHGFETFARVHAAASNLPIIVLTGLDDEELALRTVNKGAQDYLVKAHVGNRLLVRAIRYAIERKRLERQKEDLIAELKQALSEIKTLRGILPICASCKRIRDDGGYWRQVEAYVHEHTEAQFSHGVCPECLEKLYPAAAERKRNRAPNAGGEAAQ